MERTKTNEHNTSIHTFDYHLNNKTKAQKHIIPIQHFWIVNYSILPEAQQGLTLVVESVFCTYQSENIQAHSKNSF